MPVHTKSIRGRTFNYETESRSSFVEDALTLIMRCLLPRKAVYLIQFSEEPPSQSEWGHRHRHIAAQLKRDPLRIVVYKQGTDVIASSSDNDNEVMVRFGATLRHEMEHWFHPTPRTLEERHEHEVKAYRADRKFIKRAGRKLGLPRDRIQLFLKWSEDGEYSDFFSTLDAMIHRDMNAPPE